MEICKAIEPDLSRYLDRDLPAERAAELAAHLSECPLCRSTCERLERVREAVRTLEVDPALAVAARGRVFERVRVATRTVPAPLLRRRRPALGWGLSLAGALATACLLLLLPGSEPPAEALPTPGEIGLLFDLHDAHAARHLPPARPDADR